MFAECLDKLNAKKYRLDFTHHNNVIEFDGSYWHKNIEKDIIKDKFLQSKQYNILRITENEYTTHPTETIDKCIRFLNQ